MNRKAPKTALRSGTVYICNTSDCLRRFNSYDDESSKRVIYAITSGSLSYKKHKRFDTVIDWSVVYSPKLAHDAAENNAPIRCLVCGYAWFDEAEARRLYGDEVAALADDVQDALKK